MSNDIKHCLGKAQKSVTAWLFGANNNSEIGKRISTPQLIKRTLHVAYDPKAGGFTGVPVQWQAEFSNAESEATMPPKTYSLANNPQIMHSSTKSRNRVWYDQCNRKFVNLPAHWRERLLRNSLNDWPEFQRNPDLLATIFTLMDEELKQMDLTSLGLDFTFYSSLPLSTDEEDNGRAADVPAVTGHQHQQWAAGQPNKSAAQIPHANAADASGSRNVTNSTGAIVWTQQRSFCNDNESDNEEIADL